VPVLRYYSSTAQPTTLSGSISAGATSVSVGATTGFPSTTPYTLALDYGSATEELVDVTAVAGTTLTVTRGVDGTSAQSHSLGAVVRHVASGRDFGDYQTHQAATTGVHGVAGTLVGTSDTQTLGNKTLSSPTIAGGAMSGTFSGNHTYTGTVTLSGSTTAASVSGEIAHSNLYRGTRANATDSQLESRVTADAQARWFVRADGRQNWGPGNALFDTSLYRSSAKTLRTDGTFSVTPGTSGDVAYHTQVQSDTGSRFYVLANGSHSWGDGTGLVDVNLYRNGPNELKTDDSFTIAGDLQAGNIYTGPWDSWTPTWGTSSGANIPSIGNGTYNCRFAKVGRTVHFIFDVTFGTTTNFNGGGTGDNFTFTLPVATTSTPSVPNTVGWVDMRQSNTARCAGRIITNSSTTMMFDIVSGRPDGVAFTNTGTADAVTPWTWAPSTGNFIRGTGSYEAAT
jgi:hypothetical protein